MANLSKQRREKMLAFLNKIKEEHKDDSASLVALNEIENELKNRKYGLVWEQHEEQVDIMMRDNVPVFSEVKDREIEADKDKPYNFLLEGDNLHSLKLLEKTHKGKIDVIYIDPPYNTGNKDFIYDDKFIDKTDGYSHSKWLSFMSERLEVAKKLLSDSGVIFISIDDNENSQLKLLCDNIFSEENFIANIPRITKKSGKNHSDLIAKNNDFLLVYAKNKNIPKFKGIKIEEDSYKFSDKYEKTRGKYKLNQTLDYNSLWYSQNMDFEVPIADKIYIPGGNIQARRDRLNGIHDSKDWVWRWSMDKINFGLENDFIFIKKSKNGERIYTKTYSKATISKKNNNYFIEYIDRTKNLSSLHFCDNEFSNDNAKKDISKVLDSNNAFDFAKPISLIKTLLSLLKNENITILDFFAGSGTTGHAVAQLNKEDGGNRKYILCTNNENNICEDVTYKRLTNIQKDLPHNLKYYKTDFLSNDDEYLMFNMMDHITEMVQLEHGIKIDDNKYKIILEDSDADELENNLDKYPNLKGIYVSRSVLFTTKQKRKFEGLEVHVIPDYYFATELRKEGLIW